MRVELLLPEGSHPSQIILNLETIPREGERIELEGTSDWDRPIQVLSVYHGLLMGVQGLIEHVVTIRTGFFHEPSFHLDIIWQDETDRPPWLPSQLIIESEYIPRTGDLIEIGLVDADLIERAMLDETPGGVPVPSDSLVTVEIVAIKHASFVEQTRVDRELDIGFGDLESELIVRKVKTDANSDAQRLIYRRN